MSATLVSIRTPSLSHIVAASENISHDPLHAAIRYLTLPDGTSITELLQRQAFFATQTNLPPDLHALGVAAFKRATEQWLPAAVRAREPIVKVLRDCLEEVGGCYIEALKREYGAGNGDESDEEDDEDGEIQQYEEEDADDEQETNEARDDEEQNDDQQDSGGEDALLPTLDQDSSPEDALPLPIPLINDIFPDSKLTPKPNSPKQSTTNPPKGTELDYLRPILAKVQSNRSKGLPMDDLPSILLDNVLSRDPSSLTPQIIEQTLYLLKSASTPDTPPVCDGSLIVKLKVPALAKARRVTRAAKKSTTGAKTIIKEKEKVKEGRVEKRKEVRGGGKWGGAKSREFVADSEGGEIDEE
jgi:hypothetical protein